MARRLRKVHGARPAEALSRDTCGSALRRLCGHATLQRLRRHSGARPE